MRADSNLFIEMAGVGRDPARLHAAVMEHPRFPYAARALAVNMLAAGDADAALASVFKDAGRYVAAMSAAYLHRSGGLTLPRLKEICAASGYLSAGRARSLLQFLLHIRFIESVAAASPGQPARYAPTESFFAAWRAHLHAALLAACILHPAVRPLCARLDEPGVFEILLDIQVKRLHALARASDEVMPSCARSYVRIFNHRYGGTQILFTLLAVGEDETFPSRGPLPISLNLVSRRFGVSHLHVQRLLKGAMREGLLRYEAKGWVVLEESAREAIRWHYAVQLAELVASAASTLEALSHGQSKPGG